jgi:transcriptional regulator with XRE-family HTH domain
VADLTSDRIAVGRVRLGAAIRARREQLSMTRRELSQASGLGFSTINSIERGLRLPSLDSLDAIATGLETTGRALLKDVFPWDGGAAPGS